MGIGTSLGAFHEDEFRQEAAPWFLDPKDESKDNNVIDPSVDPGAIQPIKGLVIPIANLTNTPDEIMSGLEGVRQQNHGVAGPSQRERVGGASIKYKDETFEGQTHFNALQGLLEKYPKPDYNQLKEGFTTDKGRFVSREMALELARNSGQITDMNPRILGLLSEELKPISK